MQLATVRRRMARLEALADSYCPECADWPLEVGLRIVEQIVEAGEPLPEPEKSDPLQYGPCSCCGRCFRPKVIAIEVAFEEG